MQSLRIPGVDVAPIGHNNPPSPIEIFEQEMAQKYPEYFTRAKSLIEDKEKVPAEITNEAEAKKVGDYLKQIKELAKVIDSLREGEKQPYLERCRVVDGAFNKYIDVLKEIRRFVDPIQAKWVEAKKAAERRRKEEEIARKREEEERLLREAQEAERKAREEREEAARKAREEQERLDAERKRIEDEAAAKRKVQEEELRKLREEEEKAQRERQAEIDRLKAQKDEIERKDREAKQKAKDELEAAERAAKEADKAAKQKLKDEEEKAKEIERQKREEEKALKEKERKMEEEKRESERKAKALERESAHALYDAGKVEQQANRLENSKEIKSFVRGDQGSVSTTRIDWTGHLADRAQIDLETLRPYFREEDIDFAIKQFVKSGGRTLRGASIFEDTKLQVR